MLESYPKGRVVGAASRAGPLGKHLPEYVERYKPKDEVLAFLESL